MFIAFQNELTCIWFTGPNCGFPLRPCIFAQLTHLFYLLAKHVHQKENMSKKDCFACHPMLCYFISSAWSVWSIDLIYILYVICRKKLCDVCHVICHVTYGCTLGRFYEFEFDATAGLWFHSGYMWYMNHGASGFVFPTHHALCANFLTLCNTSYHNSCYVIFSLKITFEL